MTNTSFKLENCELRRRAANFPAHTIGPQLETLMFDHDVDHDLNMIGKKLKDSEMGRFTRWT